MQRSVSAPVCNVCVAENDGCVAAPVQERACLFGGADPDPTTSAAEGTGPDTSGSSGAAETTAPTGPTSSAADSDSTASVDSGSSTGPMCGNGEREGDESCDGNDLGPETCQSLNLVSGALGCSKDCTYDFSMCMGRPMCGNGTIEGGEACDGEDLGQSMCDSFAGTQGEGLSCTDDCKFDVTGCETCVLRGELCVPGAEPCCDARRCAGLPVTCGG